MSAYDETTKDDWANDLTEILRPTADDAKALEKALAKLTKHDLALLVGLFNAVLESMPSGRD